MKIIIFSIIIFVSIGYSINLDLDLKSMITENSMIFKFENQYFITLPKYIVFEIEKLRIPHYDLVKYLIKEKNLSNDDQEIIKNSIKFLDFNIYLNKTNKFDENSDGEQLNIYINIGIIVGNL